MNGPLLVRNCEVIGFDRGISSARAVNSQTFEAITLRNQRNCGFDNEGQTISVRSLNSQNSVPAVRSYGTFCLIDATLKGGTDARSWPAIVNYNGGRIFFATCKLLATVAQSPTDPRPIGSHSRKSQAQTSQFAWPQGR